MKTLEWIAYQWRKIARLSRVSIENMELIVSVSMSKGIRRSLYRGDYEIAERRLVARYLQPDDRVLEIGAGIGLISLMCARIASRGKVLSYEANPKLAELLAQNIALNGLNIQVRNRAVARHAGRVPFHVHDRFVSSSLVQRAGSHCIEVECDCFGSVVSEFSPSAVVMDVEGAETELLPSADLSKVRLVIVEVHPHITNQEAIDNMESELRAQGLLLVGQAEDVIVFQRLSMDAASAS